VSIDTFFCFIGLNKPSHTSLVLYAFVSFAD
jgi:hypothetical protein